MKEKKVKYLIRCDQLLCGDAGEIVFHTNMLYVDTALWCMTQFITLVYMYVPSLPLF